MAQAWFILKDVLKAIGMFCLGMFLLVAIVGLAAGLGWLIALPLGEQGNGALLGISLVLLLWLAPVLVEKVVGPVAAFPLLLAVAFNAWRHRRASQSPSANRLALLVKEVRS